MVVRGGQGLRDHLGMMSDGRGRERGAGYRANSSVHLPTGANWDRLNSLSVGRDGGCVLREDRWGGGGPCLGADPLSSHLLLLPPTPRPLECQVQERASHTPKR